MGSCCRIGPPAWLVSNCAHAASGLHESEKEGTDGTGDESHGAGGVYGTGGAIAGNRRVHGGGGIGARETARGDQGYGGTGCDEPDSQLDGGHMIQISPQMKILVAVEPVDLRKGIDGPLITLFHYRPGVKVISPLWP